MAVDINVGLAVDDIEKVRRLAEEIERIGDLSTRASGAVEKFENRLQRQGRQTRGLNDLRYELDRISRAAQRFQNSLREGLPNSALIDLTEFQSRLRVLDNALAHVRDQLRGVGSETGQLDNLREVFTGINRDVQGLSGVIRDVRSDLTRLGGERARAFREATPDGPRRRGTQQTQDRTRPSQPEDADTEKAADELDESARKLDSSAEELEGAADKIERAAVKLEEVETVRRGRTGILRRDIVDLGAGPRIRSQFTPTTPGMHARPGGALQPYRATFRQPTPRELRIFEEAIAGREQEQRREDTADRRDDRRERRERQQPDAAANRAVTDAVIRANQRDRVREIAAQQRRDRQQQLEQAEQRRRALIEQAQTRRTIPAREQREGADDLEGSADELDESARKLDNAADDLEDAASRLSRSASERRTGERMVFLPDGTTAFVSRDDNRRREEVLADADESERHLAERIADRRRAEAQARARERGIQRERQALERRLEKLQRQIDESLPRGFEAQIARLNRTLEASARVRAGIRAGTRSGSLFNRAGLRLAEAGVRREQRRLRSRRDLPRADFAALRRQVDAGQFDRVTGSLDALERRLRGNLTRQTERIVSAFNRMGIAIARIGPAARRAFRSVSRGARTSERSVNRLTTWFRRLHRAYLLFATGVGIEHVVERLTRTTDIVTNLENLMGAVGDGVATVGLSLRRVRDLALETFTPFEGAGVLYARILRSNDRLGFSIQQITSVTRAFQQALALSGADARETLAASVQFSQALSSGRLAGDEFKSLSESAPVFLIALRDAYNEINNTDISLKDFRDLGAEAKLTSEVLIELALRAIPQIDRQFRTFSRTYQHAFTTFGTGFTFLVNRIGTAIDRSTNLKDSLIDAGNALAQQFGPGGGGFADVDAREVLFEVGRSITRFFDTLLDRLQIFIADFDFDSAIVDAGSFVGGLLRTISSGIRRLLETAVLLVTRIDPGSVTGFFDEISSVLGDVFSGNIDPEGLTDFTRGLAILATRIAQLFVAFWDGIFGILLEVFAGIAADWANAIGGIVNSINDSLRQSLGLTSVADQQQAVEGIRSLLAETFDRFSAGDTEGARDSFRQAQALRDDNTTILEEVLGGGFADLDATFVRTGKLLQNQSAQDGKAVTDAINAGDRRAAFERVAAANAAAESRDAVGERRDDALGDVRKDLAAGNSVLVGILRAQTSLGRDVSAAQRLGTASRQAASEGRLPDAGRLLSQALEPFTGDFADVSGADVERARRDQTDAARRLADSQADAATLLERAQSSLRATVRAAAIDPLRGGEEISFVAAGRARRAAELAQAEGRTVDALELTVDAYRHLYPDVQSSEVATRHLVDEQQRLSRLQREYAEASTRASQATAAYSRGALTDSTQRFARIDREFAAAEAVVRDTRVSLGERAAVAAFPEPEVAERVAARSAGIARQGRFDRLPELGALQAQADAILSGVGEPLARTDFTRADLVEIGDSMRQGARDFIASGDVTIASLLKVGERLDEFGETVANVDQARADEQERRDRRILADRSRALGVGTERSERPEQEPIRRRGFFERLLDGVFEDVAKGTTAEFKGEFRSGVKNALTTALNANDFSEFGESVLFALQRSLNDALADNIIENAFEPLLQGVLDLFKRTGEEAGGRTIEEARTAVADAIVRERGRPAESIRVPVLRGIQEDLEAGAIDPTTGITPTEAIAAVSAAQTGEIDPERTLAPRFEAVQRALDNGVITTAEAVGRTAPLIAEASEMLAAEATAAVDAARAEAAEASDGLGARIVDAIRAPFRKASSAAEDGVEEAAGRVDAATRTFGDRMRAFGDGIVDAVATVFDGIAGLFGLRRAGARAAATTADIRPGAARGEEQRIGGRIPDAGQIEAAGRLEACSCAATDAIMSGIDVPVSNVVAAQESVLEATKQQTVRDAVQRQAIVGNLQSLIQAIQVQTVADSLNNAVATFGGSGGGGGGGGISMDPWQYGGLFGEATPGRHLGALTAEIYAGLPKFHTGGFIPGARGQEVPIMAQAGEYVSSVAEQNSPAGRGGVNVRSTTNVTGNIDRPTRAFLSRNSAELARMVARENRYL